MQMGYILFFMYAACLKRLPTLLKKQLYACLVLKAFANIVEKTVVCNYASFLKRLIAITVEKAVICMLHSRSVCQQY